MTDMFSPLNYCNVPFDFWLGKSYKGNGQIRSLDNKGNINLLAVWT